MTNYFLQWLITSHQRLITSVHDWERVNHDWLRVTAINFQCARATTNIAGVTNLEVTFKGDHISKRFFVTMDKLLFCDERPCHSRSLLVAKAPRGVVQKVKNILGKGGASISHTKRMGVLVVHFRVRKAVLIPLKAAKYEIQKPSTCSTTFSFVASFGRYFPFFVAGWRKLLRKVERGSALSNKFWLCCWFFKSHWLRISRMAGQVRKIGNPETLLKEHF